MFIKRLLVTVILTPIGIAVIYLGGLPFTLFVALVLALAAWEFVQMWNAGGFKPAGVLVILGTLLLFFTRAYLGFDHADIAITFLVLASMIFHLFAFEKGREQAGTDFALTLAGIFYLGWIGAYFVSVRTLPEGRWWMLLILPSVWFADSGAYAIGKNFGKHQLTPHLSPKKTWEGYLAGIAAGALGGALLGWLLPLLAGPASGITPLRGALIGLVLGVLTLFGDLGESMLKRQVRVKDSSNLLPGHGGVFDRIDSWLWGVVLGFYIVVLFF